MVNVTSLIVKAGSGLRFSFGVRAWTEMEIQCVNTLHAEIIYTSPFINAEIKIICLRSKWQALLIKP